MWLYGYKENGVLPVKLYDTGETTAAIIKHYSDIKWIRSGNRRELIRFKIVVKEIYANKNESKDIFSTYKQK